MIYRRYTSRWGNIKVTIRQVMPGTKHAASISQETIVSEHDLVKRPLNKHSRTAFANHIIAMRKELRNFIRENTPCEQ